MRIRLKAYGVAAAVFALDRLTKWIVETRVSLADTRTVIPGFFDIVRNQSALLADDRAVFLARHLQTLIEAGDDPATANTLLEQAKLSALKAVPAGDKNYTPSQLAVIDAYSHLNQVLANIPLSEEDPGAKTMMDDARSDISKSLGWVLQGLQTGPSPPPARLPHQA